MRKGTMIAVFVLALAVAYASSQQPVQSPSTGTSGAAQVSSSDAALQAKVQSKLAGVAAFKNVNASVRGGVVDLSGTVTSQPDQKRAKDFVSKIAGVKSVNEHLSIGEAGAAGSTASAVVPQTAQSETANNTAGSIAGNSGAIGSTTGDSRPTNPAVTTQTAAGNNAPAGNAVADTRNHPTAEAAEIGLGMTPDVDANTLRSQIDSALKSEPTLSNSQLNVDVNDSQITLSGSVPTGKEKQTAVRIAQSYAGNRRVSDKVTLAGKQAAPNAQTPNAVGTNPK